MSGYIAFFSRESTACSAGGERNIVLQRNGKPLRKEFEIHVAQKGACYYYYLMEFKKEFPTKQMGGGI